MVHLKWLVFTMVIRTTCVLLLYWALRLVIMMRLGWDRLLSLAFLGVVVVGEATQCRSALLVGTVNETLSSYFLSSVESAMSAKYLG